MKSRYLTPKISIICVGEIHTDSAAKDSILCAIKKFHARKIPVVYCPESPLDTKLIEYSKLLNSNVELLSSDSVIKKYNLEEILLKPDGQLFPYFSEDKREEVENKIRTVLIEEQHIEDLELLSSEFCKLSGHRSSRNILNYLIKNNISYVPIDLETIERDKTSKDITEENTVDVVLKYEKMRISTMTENIYQKAIKPLETTGGIIICNVGIMHAHRLAVNLYIKSQIKPIVLHCYADHGFDLDQMIEINNTKITFDSNETLKLYSEVPYKTFHFSYTNQNKLKFNKKFNEIIRSTISCHQYSTNDSHHVTLNKSINYSKEITMFGLSKKRKLFNNASEAHREVRPRS
jgi:hypothetical protein